MQRMFAIGFVFMLGTAGAQDTSTDSTGDYERDLGQVYGAIRASRYMGEICTEAFAGEAPTNTAAYNAWRNRYLSFIQEVEKHLSSLLWKKSEGDPKRHVELLNAWEKSFDGYRDALRAKLRSSGSEAFSQQCKLYPELLSSPRQDLERYYAEQVVVIRNGAIGAQVSEGIYLAAATKAAVAETFLYRGTVPANRTLAGMSPNPTDTHGKYVASVAITKGRVDITYGNEADPALAGKVLSITPYGVRDSANTRSVVWRCGLATFPVNATQLTDYASGTIEPKYLPPGCRP